MSDPVTNLDSADVLSSLRRLVSVTPTAAPSLDPSGCLVLTPSFRVAPDKLVLESPVPTSAASLAATIKELEAALGVTPGDWEPDGSEADASPGHWPDMQPLAFRPAPVAADPAPEVDPAPVMEGVATAPAIDAIDDMGDDLADNTAIVAETLRDGAEDLTIDETALRAIVADVLRQELQGELGERITRNVRKLVRREIFRVLNSDETG
jgi:cell pole-organizing protein PopZ